MIRILTIVFICCFLCSCNNSESNSEADTTRDLTDEEIGKALLNEENLKVDSIGIFIYDGFFDLDAIGPFSVLSNMIGTKVFFIAENKGVVKSSSGLEISVSNEIEMIDKLDILMIPGGSIGTIKVSKNKKVLDWINKINQHSTFTTSVCTGAWILGESGLLNGKKATTNWYRAEEKLNKYGATFENERWVKDGKLWTSAGVSAGIDMSLALISEIKGPTYMKLAMLNLEYDPSPPIEEESINEFNKGLEKHMTKMYDALMNN